MAVVEAKTLDVDALNDAAAVLWDEAHGRGARAGEEKAMGELVEYHGGQMRALARQMLDSALSCEAEEQWRLASFAHALLGRTPGSGTARYGRVLGLLTRAVPARGVPDAGLLREAREALGAMDGGA